MLTKQEIKIRYATSSRLPINFDLKNQSAFIKKDDSLWEKSLIKEYTSRQIDYHYKAYSDKDGNPIEMSDIKITDIMKTFDRAGYKIRIGYSFQTDNGMSWPSMSSLYVEFDEYKKDLREFKLNTILEC